jgi:hypothetical protein
MFVIRRHCLLRSGSRSPIEPTTESSGDEPGARVVFVMNKDAFDAAEEKIRIVLDGLRGETSIAELCRRAARL